MATTPLSVKAPIAAAVTQPSRATGNRASTAAPVPSPEGADAVRVSIQPQQAERAERRQRNFSKIDSNDDNSLSREELEAAQARRQADGFKTPLIDRALEQYDQLNGESGKEGVTFGQFFGSTPRKPDGNDGTK